MLRCTHLVVACSLLLLGCGGNTSSGAGFVASHSSSIAIEHTGKTLYVVNADADSVSVIDAAMRTLTKEIPLSSAPPAVDSNGAFTPSVMPRTLALSGDEKTLYVVGERAGALLVIDLATSAVTTTVAVGSEPFAVVVSASSGDIYVSCSQDDTVVQIDPTTLKVIATASMPRKPWALAFTTDQKQLIATQLLTGAITAIDPTTMVVSTPWPIADIAPRGDRRLAHGIARGLYDLVPRPTTTEIWAPHFILGTDTSQPTLDFESTAFPAVSIVSAIGSVESTLFTDAPDVPGIDGSFTDVVSGPHALQFTADGKYALMVDADSEDLLLIDATNHVESALLRPLPGHMPEGIVLSPDGTSAYVDERNTSDIAVISITQPAVGAFGGPTLAVDGDPIQRIATDPMPDAIRLGQHLFYSANSDEYPLTKNHWIACATCHIEGRSDAVTWLFAQGPRDTPSNAGGTLGTGFLFRTADRNQVQDYWHTINIEQGGNFNDTDPTLMGLLDNIADYVNYGIPQPVPPTTDPVKVAAGKIIFNRSDVMCATCHSGPRFTDSGSGNPTLDLAGLITLHDVGTCVIGGTFPDVAHTDENGDPRAACAFDTPALNGVWDSAPYLHDGSAATLKDVLENTRGKMGDISSLSASDEDALVEYLKSL